jgi:KDO2-lipid IV(A) lauroyltransferase
MQFFTHIIHAVAFLFLRYRQDVIESNLLRSLPELSPSDRERAVGRFQRHFSELFFEMAMFTRLKPNTRRIRPVNPEMLAEACSRGENIIVMAGHYGNWEWNLLPMLSSGYRVMAVYKPQVSSFADQLMALIRLKPGISLITMKETFRKVSGEIESGNAPFALLLVADQIPARPDIRFWTRFLNQDTAFFTGGEKLSRRFGLPVYYMEQSKKGFARYEVQAKLLHDGRSTLPDGDLTRKFASALEQSIRKDPGLWLWSHRRWKYPHEQ